MEIDERERTVSIARTIVFCMHAWSWLELIGTAAAVGNAQAEVQPRKMSPVFCSSTECLSVANLRIAWLYPLYLFLDESVVRRWNTLSLLRWAYRWHLLLIVHHRIHGHCPLIPCSKVVTPRIIRYNSVLHLVFLSGACLVERPKIHGENHRAMPTSNSHNVVGTIVWHVHHKDGVAILQFT